MMQHKDMNFKLNNVPVITNSNQLKKRGCGSPYFIITDLINIFKMFRVCPISKTNFSKQNFLSLT